MKMLMTMAMDNGGDESDDDDEGDAHGGQWMIDDGR